MEKCPNHQDKDAAFTCHSCGKHFCELCLTETGDYYYCNSPECREHINILSKQDLLPEEITCPNCSEDLELEEEERVSRQVHCSECGSLIDFTTEPPAVMNPEEYVEITSSINQGDIGVIRSLLDDAEINYYIFGENFLVINPLLQPARVFVIREQVEEAKKILKDVDIHIFGVSFRNEDEQ